LTTYTIDTENTITAHTSKQEAGEGESFSSQQELASLVAEWSANRLIEVWNGIPGLLPVKKFTDRKSGVARIWKAIQSLDGGNATEREHDCTEGGEESEVCREARQEGKEPREIYSGQSRKAEIWQSR